jgi:hypothetical protein
MVFSKDKSPLTVTVTREVPVDSRETLEEYLNQVLKGVIHYGPDDEMVNTDILGTRALSLIEAAGFTIQPPRRSRNTPSEEAF